MTRRKKRILLIAVASVLLLIGAVGAPSLGRAQLCRYRIREELQTPKRCGKAHLDLKSGIPVLHLYGSPQDMGKQYGTILKQALTALQIYMEIILPTSMREQILSTAKTLEPALPESYRVELKAISEASGVPYTTLLAMNLIPRIRCSALAVWGKATPDGAMIMGRNAEYFSFGLGDRGSLVVVYHPDKGLPVASVNFLGMIGSYTGVNAEGVAFGNMLVFNAGREPLQEDGLAIHLLMRQAGHECRSAQAMGDWLRKQKHVIPINVMVADAKDAQVLELGLKESDVRVGKEGVLAVTNYFRSPRLYVTPTLCNRYDTLLNAAKEHYGKMTAADMSETLNAAQIKNLNIQAAMFEPGAMRMHVSINRTPACAGPYVVFDLKALFQDKE